jgi:hypothetical protein
MSVPVVSPPQNLQGAMKDLFSEQEKERYRLRMQVTSSILSEFDFPSGIIQQKLLKADIIVKYTR